MAAARSNYYLPNPGPWPITVSAALFLLTLGFALLINDVTAAGWFMLAGVTVLVVMAFRWFGKVIDENENGIYNPQVDRSFRISMAWFIFSEVMLFGALFGALFYMRLMAVPTLGETESLWPGYEGAWPSSGPKGSQFTPMAAWGIPAVNTVLFLSSSATVIWAHSGLLRDNRAQLVVGLVLTVALGLTFLGLQIYEYARAYTELGLTLKTGAYGATFFILTGFHGFHVVIGAIMLIVILLRAIRGHFTPENHFGFEGVAWYWHFLDVVWLCLFIFVYWL